MRDDRPKVLAESATDWPREADGAPGADLTRRLESLPDGHPSSRYEADGTLRDQAVRLRDLDTADDDYGERADSDQGRLFTDTEWTEHLTEVRGALIEAHKAGLSTLRQYAIDEDGEAWAPSRRHVHQEIIDELYGKSASVPRDHKAIVAGGLAGAGKTTVLANHAGIDRSQYLTINPDDIKVEMATRGLIPKVDGLSEMEAADLVHAESSHVAKQLALRARADGKNLIWDITMSTSGSVQERIDGLRGSGYTEVRGIFVDIPIDVSTRRADARHREGEDDYRSGKGLGGRYVPSEVITAQADEDWGSKNRKTFEELKPAFDHWMRFDNGVDDRDPILVDTGSTHDPEEIRP